jgi:hypothetical protein
MLFSFQRPSRRRCLPSAFSLKRAETLHQLPLRCQACFLRRFVDFVLELSLGFAFDFEGSPVTLSRLQRAQSGATLQRGWAYRGVFSSRQPEKRRVSLFSTLKVNSRIGAGSGIPRRRTRSGLGAPDRRSGLRCVWRWPLTGADSRETPWVARVLQVLTALSACVPRSFRTKRALRPGRRADSTSFDARG